MANDAAAVVLLLAPTAAILLLWIFLEINGATGPSSRCVRDVAVLLAATALVGQSLLLLHAVDLADCDGALGVVVRALPLAGNGVFHLLAALAIYRGGGLARLFVALQLLAAGAVAFVEWGLRGGLALSPAAYPLTALQQTYALQAVSTLHFVALRQRRRVVRTATQAKRGESVARALSPVDALARRGDARGGVPAAGERDRSWFAV